MAFLINPNLAHLLVVVGVTLLLLTNINSKSTLLKVGMVLCLVAADVEFFYLKVNPWAFLVVALSPLPFFIAVRQARAQNPLFLLSILMLAIGSVFLFVDQNNRPILIFGPAGFVSTMCAAIIWIATDGLRNAEGARLSNDPDSVVGLIGETQTEIESHSAGSVMVGGELWQAHSKKPIPAGSTVRVLRQDGFWLTVKKVEKLTKE
ncbi:MAG TPA: NfeD family protein [Anaerolineales bacterium]|nr:NfeD family protein [Anaerolineales bacterium]